jgi:hypothetical protein
MDSKEKTDEKDLIIKFVGACSNISKGLDALLSNKEKGDKISGISQRYIEGGKKFLAEHLNYIGAFKESSLRERLSIIKSNFQEFEKKDYMSLEESDIEHYSQFFTDAYKELLNIHKDYEFEDFCDEVIVEE